MSGERLTVDRLGIGPADNVDSLGPKAHDRAVITVLRWARRVNAADDERTEVADTDIREMCWELGVDYDVAVARARHERAAAEHGADSLRARTAHLELLAEQHVYAERKEAWRDAARLRAKKKGAWWR